MRKIILASVLTAAMALTLLSLTAIPAFAATGSLNIGEVVTGLPAGIDIDSATGIISGTPTTAGAVGGFIIDLSDNNPPDLGAGWTYENGVYTVIDGANVTVTGISANNRRIAIAAGVKAIITLDNASIITETVYGLSPLALSSTGDTRLTLNLSGTNTLTANSGGAGIHVPANATLTIYGPGAVNAKGTGNGAGIGGYGNNFGASDSGVINIHGGTVNATCDGGSSGAGIGGGYRGNGGTVNMYGGYITATGSANAVAIGRGHGIDQNASGAHGALNFIGGITYGYWAGQNDQAPRGTGTLAFPNTHRYIKIAVGILTFDYGARFDIPATRLGEAIAAIDVSTGVSGGAKPYTFSAAGLPAGISINSATGIISGAYTAAVAPGTATITVTDNELASESITMNYGVVGADIGLTIDLYLNNPPASGDGWTYNNSVYTVLNGADVKVAGINRDRRRVAVAENATATISMEDVTITGLFVGEHALMLGSGANLTLNLAGVNTLKSNGSPGISMQANSTLTIYGPGTVNATGGTNGAGIGGFTVSGCTVNIRSGTVNATGGINGAGIGGNNQSSGCTVNVHGGTVTATGGIDGAGIGGGNNGNGGTVNINGGEVTATGGIRALAIGRGGNGGTDGTLNIDTASYRYWTGESAPGTHGTGLLTFPNTHRYVKIETSDATKPLTFTHSAAFDIPEYVINAAIANINTYTGVSGGVQPYTFSAVGLPAGITVDSATGIISGVPTTAGAAGTATITVTDSASNSEDITINFGTVHASGTIMINDSMTGQQMVRLIEAALIANTVVTVVGRNSNPSGVFELTIPAGRRVVWKAVYTRPAQMLISGAGTFEVADGANITVTTSSFRAITLHTDHVAALHISGGIITKQDTTSSEPVIWSNRANRSITMTGGMVISPGTAMPIQNNGAGSTTAITGGTLFFHGTSANMPNSNATVSGNGVVIAWNPEARPVSYTDGTSDRLVSNPAGNAVWDYAGKGIRNLKNNLIVTIDGVTVVPFIIDGDDWSWDPANNKLTITGKVGNIDITTTGGVEVILAGGSKADKITQHGDGNLTISVTGNATGESIVNNGTGDITIASPNGSSLTLNAVSGPAISEFGDIVINSGNIYASTATPDTPAIVSAGGSVTIGGTANVSAETAAGSGSAISAATNINISTSGSVKATTYAGFSLEAANINIIGGTAELFFTAGGPGGAFSINNPSITGGTVKVNENQVYPVRITSFTLAGVAGTINESAGTIAVTVPFGTNVTNLIPTITHNGASISPTGAQNFTSSVMYTVTSAYNSTKTYIVTVAVGSGAVVPGAPTIGTATAGNGQATVSFTPPANNGGSAITGYTVTSNPGGITVTVTSSPITVTGLTNGTAYTFTVVATNAVGNSPASAASNSVTPTGGGGVCGNTGVGSWGALALLAALWLRKKPSAR